MTRTGIATTLDRGVFPAVAGPVSVHSVFRAAANLVTPGGLFTLVAASKPAGPSTAVLDFPALDALALRLGATGHLTSTDLRIGALRIDLTPATTWHPTPSQGPIRRDAVDHLARRLEGVHLGDGPTGHTSPAAHPTPFQEAVAEQLDARTRRFTDAVSRHHLDDARQAAASLLGLGHGLTPSGDDWLVGFVLAAHHSPDALGTASAAVDEAARPGSTVDISLSILRNALRGRAVDPLHRLLAALTRPPGPDLGEALARLAEIGHSSGTDLALGLLAAAHLITDTQGAQ